MKHLLIGVLAVHLIQFAALAVRADRLEAFWIGPDGNGGEGDWNTASNWNLGVAPNNGTDADGDGVPDIFDVRIDGLPAAMSVVQTNAPPVEIAGLTIEAGDTLDLVEPTGLVLNDPNGEIEVDNDGLVRVGGNGFVPSLVFSGESLRLSGRGVLELGAEEALPGIFAAREGGRVINGPEHTIRTIGPRIGGRLVGYDPESVIPHVALTNEGTITAEDRSELRLHLNDNEHYNYGAIQASTQARAWLLSQVHGTFHNHGELLARDLFGQIRVEGLEFVNESDGLIRATEHGSVRFSPLPAGKRVTNRGLIEATAGGEIRIEGTNIVNEGSGVIQAQAGGGITLTQGTFYPDSAIRLLDHESRLTIFNAVFENEGNVLKPPGPGVLSLAAHIRGGAVTDGIGRLVMGGVVLEDVNLSGHAVGTGMGIRGTVTFESSFNFDNSNAPVGSLGLFAAGPEAILAGPGVSKFDATTVFTGDGFLRNAAGHQSEFEDLTIRGTLINNGVILTNGTSIHEGVLAGDGVIVSGLLGLFQGSTLSPGDGIGTMPVFGRVWFTFNSTFRAELAESQSDLLDITGNLTIAGGPGANLVLSGGLIGESYVIAQYTGERLGMFENVTPGYDVIYDDVAKQIRVQPIPEPASILLALLGMSISTLYLRKRITQSKGLL